MTSEKRAFILSIVTYLFHSFVTLARSFVQRVYRVALMNDTTSSIVSSWKKEKTNLTSMLCLSVYLWLNMQEMFNVRCFFHLLFVLNNIHYDRVQFNRLVRYRLIVICSNTTMINSTCTIHCYSTRKEKYQLWNMSYRSIL
jgi:hypothetical protein